MTKADHAVEKSADSLEPSGRQGRQTRHDGVGEWLAEELKNDAAFLRKAEAEPDQGACTEQESDAPTAPSAPSGPQLAGSSPKKKRRQPEGAPARSSSSARHSSPVSSRPR